MSSLFVIFPKMSFKTFVMGWPWKLFHNHCFDNLVTEISSTEDATRKWREYNIPVMNDTHRTHILCEIVMRWIVIMGNWSNPSQQSLPVHMRGEVLPKCFRTEPNIWMWTTIISSWKNRLLSCSTSVSSY